MKGRLLVYDRDPATGQGLAALSVDGRLSELDVSSPVSPQVGGEASPGGIFRGAVTRLLNGAAFIDLGSGLSGFLPKAEGLREGERLLVEVVRPAEASKAARLSRRLSLPYRKVVLTVGAPGVNVSKAIGEEAERERLKQIADAALKPALSQLGAVDDKGIGLVVRSAAEGSTAEALAHSIAQASARLGRMLSSCETGLLVPPWQSFDLALVDWSHPTPRRILVPLADAERLRERTRQLAPELADRVEGSAGSPLSDAGLDTDLQSVVSPRVALAQGDVVLHRNEALIAIDVNAGDTKSIGAVNRAAAVEIPRQLRLRGWGGMVVIDFAGTNEAERPALVAALKAAGGADWRIAGWGPLGLLEATLPRRKHPVEEILPADWPTA
ncbi:MAG: ribonuclease E/G [Pseudomonadota bacterium]